MFGGVVANRDTIARFTFFTLVVLLREHDLPFAPRRFANPRVERARVVEAGATQSASYVQPDRCVSPTQVCPMTGPVTVFRSAANTCANRVVVDVCHQRTERLRRYGIRLGAP